MAEYKNGIITRERILVAARKFFYTKGYYETTYYDLCNEVGISPGTFHHHFKSKDELYEIIYRETIDQNRQEAKLLTKSEDRYVLTAMESLLFWYKFFHDEKYRDFCAKALQIIGHHNPHVFYDLYNRNDDIKQVYSHNESHLADLKVVAEMGINYTLNIYLMENLERYSFKDITRFNLTCASIFLEYDKEKIEKALEICLEILGKVNPQSLKYTFYD